MRHRQSLLRLLAAGKPAGLPVAIVENASLPDQRIRYTTLSALPRLAAAQITGSRVDTAGTAVRGAGLDRRG